MRASLWLAAAACAGALILAGCKGTSGPVGENAALTPSNPVEVTTPYGDAGLGPSPVQNLPEPISVPTDPTTTVTSTVAPVPDFVPSGSSQPTS
ncbi:MAG: hypothetical protein ACRDYC_05920 [Acidimicrobiales bacterium]